VALGLWLVGTTKVYPALGADTVMESITLIVFGGKQDSGCKLLENRLRAAWHQQKSSKIVL